MLAHLTAARMIRDLPRRPSHVPADTLPSRRWRHRLRQLKTTNPHPGLVAVHDELVRAAIYPDAIQRAAAALSSRQR